MKIAEFRVLRVLAGPNIHGPKPMIEAHITLQSGETVDLAGAFRRATACLDALKPSYIEERLEKFSPVSPADIEGVPGLVAYFAVLLQQWMGLPVSTYVLALEPSQPLSERLAYEIRLPQYGKVAGEVATFLCAYALKPSLKAAPEQLTARITQFISSFVEPTVVPSYVRAAETRGTPWRLLFDGGGFMNFGQGRHQHRTWQNFTDQTGHVPTVLSTRKHLAAPLFRAHGLPAPQQHVVTSADDAVRAAHQLGFPVVVKPASKDFGTAVNADLRNDQAVRAAFAIAAPHGAVLVEEFIPGFQHRMTVMHGRLTSVRRHKPAHVVGDGRSTVRMLVQEKNRTPFYKPIALDETTIFVLSKTGKTLESVPAEGEEVILRTQANLQAGGTMDIVTDITHPDNATLAIRAAAVMGIDVAGVDFITPDITRSHLEVGGGICEINVTPAFLMDEESILINDWYPPDNDGRIPMVVLLDPLGTEISRHVESALRRTYPVVTTATGDGVFLNGKKIAPGEPASQRGAFIAIYEPSTCAAIIEYSSELFVANGSPFDRCDVLVVPERPSAQQQLVIDRLRPIAGVVLVYGETSKTIDAITLALDTARPAST